MLSDVEARVLTTITDGDAAAMLTDYVRMPSITGSDAESDLQHRCVDQLTAAGMSVDAWKFDLDALARDPRFPGVEVPRTEGYGVVGVSSGEGDPALILQAHVDVVPTGDVGKWDGADPFSASIVGGVLHGRGACDMKGGLASVMLVLQALRRERVELVRPLGVHTVVSEEDGGLGAFATMLRGHRGDCAVIPEPTSGKVVVANAGALTFRLSVHGRAAHGSVRHEGVSAVSALYPLLHALDVLETRRNREPGPMFGGNTCPYPISVGTVHAGDWASSVPDLLLAEGRMGVILDEDPDEARRQMTEAIAEASARDPWLRENPPTLEWIGGQFASGRLPDAHPLLGDVQAAAFEVRGSVPEPAAAPYGSDLRLYVGIGGIPSLHFGPGDVRHAHAPREQVPISDVTSIARTLALLAIRRCGVRAVR
jgi:acetylornithine deacetylase